MRRSITRIATAALPLLIVACLGASLSAENPLRDGASLGAAPDTLGEGFFRPGEIAVPENIEAHFAGIVRVRPLSQFELELHETPEAAAEARADNPEKRYLPEGGNVWPVVLDPSVMTTLCAHPAARLQPAYYELCGVWTPGECEDWPCTFTTPPLEGSATGVVVGRLENGDYVIATNYHVARESIERHERTGGRHSHDPVEAPDVTVALSADGEHARSAYRVVEDVRLLAHASEEEWQRDEDWALLSIPADAVSRELPVVPLAEARPAEDDTLWAGGFPTRSGRRLGLESPYRNANDDFRVSVGTAEGHDERGNLLSTLDAVSGSSGSPVFDRTGRIVGLLHDTTYREGEFDLRIAEYGGLAQIVPAALLREILAELPLQDR